MSTYPYIPGSYGKLKNNFGEQGRTKNKQRDPVMKSGFSCNHYNIFPATGKNRVIYGTTLLSALDLLDSYSAVQYIAKKVMKFQMSQLKPC